MRPGHEAPEHEVAPWSSTSPRSASMRPGHEAPEHLQNALRASLSPSGFNEAGHEAPEHSVVADVVAAAGMLQ